MYPAVMVGSVWNMDLSWSGDRSCIDDESLVSLEHDEEENVHLKFFCLTDPLSPTNPGGGVSLQGGRVDRVSQQLPIRPLQVIFCHVILFQRHMAAAPIPPPSQCHHVTATTRSLGQQNGKSELQNSSHSIRRHISFHFFVVHDYRKYSKYISKLLKKK